MSTAQSGTDLLHLLPPLPQNWELAIQDTIYTPESLYDYINGGAELYLSYDMKEVASRIIAQGENEIRLEIFDMKESRNAFGVFSHTRSMDEKEYGQGSQYFTGTLIFWKATYYVAITANDENDEIIEAIHKLGEKIDQAIPDEGPLPSLIQLLPEQGLLRDGYVYFYHYIWLNSYYYIANENILNIDPQTEAILAKYGDKSDRYYLLLVKYPDAEAAITAHSALIKELGDGSTETQLLGEKGWMSSTKSDPYLLAVFNAPDKETAELLLNSCLKQIRETKP